jgi:hypothetical protein
MKKLLAVALVNLALISGHAFSQIAPTVSQPQATSPDRVLLVGNSYLYYNDSLHNYLRRMVVAGEPEKSKSLQYKSATIGGASLAHHNIDWLTTPGRIGVKQPFELVILQGLSNDALTEKGQAAFRTAAQEATKLVTDRGGKAAIYMVHAYVAPHKLANPDNNKKIRDYYTEVGNELNAIVLPVGLAFEEAYKRHPELKLHKSYDGSHPSAEGTYLAAATLYGTLYGKPITGNSFDAFGEVDPETIKKLQTVADDVVKSYFGRP